MCSGEPSDEKKGLIHFFSLLPLSMEPVVAAATEATSSSFFRVALGLVADAAMIFCPVSGYLTQYREIVQTNNPEGFSLWVCFILLTANILRIFFWLGKRFENVLLYQAVVMLMAQFFLLDVVTRTRRAKRDTRPHATPTGVLEKKYWTEFWAWEFLSQYVNFILLLVCVAAIFTYTFSRSMLYNEILGYVSLSIEAGLGLPQFVRNFRNHSTSGLSFFLIFTWILGDSFKTCYFLIKGSPAQFVMCGMFQIVVDLLIIRQIMIYPSHGPHGPHGHTHASHSHHDTVKPQLSA